MNCVWKFHIILYLFLLSLPSCAFIPRSVDISTIKNRIDYPREKLSPRHYIKFESFEDVRPQKSSLGVGRNKLMMVTTTIGISAGLKELFEEMVREHFSVNGIGDGDSQIVLRGKILDAQTDAVGPDHIFVEVKTSLTLLKDSDHSPILYRILKGRGVTPVTQVTNTAWEDAFIEALNQISEQVQNLALMTATAMNDTSPRISEQSSEFPLGSCVALDNKGTILTAYHVIENLKNPFVHFMDGQNASLSVLRVDPANDLALLKSEIPTEIFLPFASSKSQKLGQYIFTIGYPASSILGLDPKFTEGSISSLTGPSGMANLFQISIPLQPGNSGGPVVNERGELVGIANSTAAVANFVKETGSLPQNVNWAIKAEYASLLLDFPSSLPPTLTRQDAIERAKAASCFITEKSD